MAWYNDYLLPDLPEYDAQSYPHACIQWIPYSGGGFIAHLRLSNWPFFAIAGTVSNTPGAVVIVHSYSSASGTFAWGKSYSLARPALELPAGTVVWTSADITDENGEVFLAPSEPQPTQSSSASDFRMSSWLIGVMLGLACRHPADPGQ